ncbi:hypothetical protein V0288_12150 [Pannus brasiliensis CCIBt3594]|uniref:Tetratricopeptide repeat protein n=1 Tax=Pannus brasiliensis CCIBt3594 TaxID=1427578 RepID=A0AAW9QLS6_9CHRO
MFPRSNFLFFLNALMMSTRPFAMIIGLVLFGMLTAPPGHRKQPETVAEILTAAEGELSSSDYDGAIELYDRLIAKTSDPFLLSSAYWGRGAARLGQFTTVNSKVRWYRLEARTDKGFVDDYETASREAKEVYDRGVADHLKAAEIAESAGMTDCGREIREILPRLPKGMIRYNNPYGFYTGRKPPRCYGNLP